MNPKHPTDVMRATIIHGRVDCENCKHWIPTGQVPWCKAHKFNDDAPGYYHENEHAYCMDFELKHHDQA